MALEHEMRHAIGIDHASTDFNNAGVIDAEYGDLSDAMGNGSCTFNAPHRVQAGWLASTTISANGTYTVAPLELTNGTRVFTYFSPTGNPHFSYRQAVGFDGSTTWFDGATKTPIDSPFTMGLSVHRFSGTGHSYQIMDPLSDGVSYTIPGTSVIVKQTSHNSSGTTFTVNGITKPSSTIFSAAGTYRFTSYDASGGAIEVLGFSTTNGTQLVIYPWNSGSNQQFNFVGMIARQQRL